MSFTQDLFTSRRNFGDGSTRVGQEGRIWYDPISNSFRIGDGITVGGTSIGVAEIHAAGVGIAVNQHTGNITISSNATSLAIPDTIVSRNSSNATFLDQLTSNVVIVTGNLTVLGNTKFVDQQLLSIQNKNLILANTSPAPSDFAANGGGLILLGTSNHSILWDQTSASWESTEHWNLTGNKFYAIDHVPVLTVNSVLDTVSTANLAVAGTLVRIGATTGNTIVRNNLHVNGNLTVDGSFPIRRDYDYLNFDTTISAPTYLEGRIFYDNVEKSLAYYADNNELTLNIGQETVFRATNKSGVILYSGNVVYISGAIGDRPTVARARADSITTAQAVGVVTTTIADNATGYVTLNGIIHDVDTAGMTDGAVLYLSPTVAGAFTTTRPTHPNYEVQVGYVTRVNKNNGHFALAIRNAAFSQLMVNGEANFESNLTIDRNLAVTGNAAVTGRLAVTGESTLASATVSDLTSGRIVLVGASGSLNDSYNFAYNTGTNTLNTVNASLSGTLSAGATTLNSAAITTSLTVGSTLAVTGATTLSSTLTAGATTLASASVNTSLAVGTTLAVTGSSTFTGTSAFTGDVTAVNIDSTTLDTTGSVTVGGSLQTTGNLVVNNDRLVVNASSGDTTISGSLNVAGSSTISGSNLNLPATFNLGPNTNDLRLGAVFGTTRVRNNLEVDGDVTIDGGYLNASTIAFNLLNSTTTIVTAFGSTTSLTLGASSGTTNIRNNVLIDNNLTVSGGTLSVTTTSFTLANTTATSVNAFGSAQTINFGSSGGAGIITVRNDNLVLLGNLQMNGGAITTNQNTFNLIPSTATTVNFAGAASTVNIAGSNSVTNLLGNLQVRGNNITSTQTSFDLLNDTVTTLNIGAAANAVNIGAASGSLTVRNSNTVLNGSLEVKGGAITTNQNSFNLVNSTATTVNIAGAATTLNLGSTLGTGTTNILNNLYVTGNLLVNGTNVTFNSAVSVVNDPVMIIGGPPPATIDDNKDRGIQFTWHTGTQAKIGFFGWDDSQQLFTFIPDATNSGEVFTGIEGAVKFGAIAGTTGTFSSQVDVQGNLLISNGRINSSQSSLYLFDTSTTINLGAAASAINLGSSGGSVNTIGDLQVRGGNLTTNLTTFNLLDTGVTTVNIAGAATAIRIGATTGNLIIRNANTVLDGSLDVRGGSVTTNQTTFNLVNTVATTVNLAGQATIVNIAGAASTTNLLGSLEVRGQNLTTTQTTFNLVDNIATTLNIAGAATLVRIGAATGTLTIRNSNTVLDGALEVKGSGITTNQSSFNIVNTTASTVNLAGAASILNLASSSSSTNVLGNLEIRGQNLVTTQGTFNLLNTVVTNLNIGAAASTINLGAAGGALTIRNDSVILDGDLLIKGGDLTTNLSGFNLINTNAIAVNAFGAAVSLTMGATSGVTNIRNNLDVDGTINLDGATLGTSSSSFSLLNTAATNVAAFGAATLLTVGAPTGTTTVRNKLNLNNDLDVLGSVNIDNNLVVDGTVNIDGAVDIDNSLDVLTNLNVGNNLTVVGTVTIGSPGFNSTSLNFNLLNTYTTTINAFGAALLVEIGSTLGKTSINNELEVEGAALSTSRTTFDLVNTTATTLNFAGAATSLLVGATSGTTRIRNNVDIDGTLNIDGGTITVSGASLTFADSSVTTVNAFGAATALTMAATTGTTSIRNNLAVSGSLTVGGDLTVNGTLTTLNSVTLTVDDKNIELGSITTPTDTTADGGGITLRGTTQKTLNWINATGAWTSSEHFDIVAGKEYRINNVLMLSSTTLGTSVVNSSLTSVGTIGTGVWQGTLVSPTYGGTGVNNGSKTITLGGNFATAGNFNLTLVLTAASTITLPTTGTVATLAGVETFTNKSINLANNTLTGTLAEFNSALSGADFASLAGTETLTNKTVNLTNNTLSGTRAQFDAALSDDNFGYTGSKLSQFAATTSSELASVITDETGTGVLVFNNSPTLITPTLGVATATSINKVTITAPATAATLTIANNKTLTVSNSVTFTGTDSASVAFGAGGTVVYTTNKLDVFAATTSAELAAVISDETGTGNLVLSNSPTLVTPVLGNASATSVSISSILTLTPLGAAPAGATAGTFAVADNAGGGWDPAAKGGSTPYPVFYDGATWHALY